MIAVVFLLQVAVVEPQWTRDSVNKVLLPVQREVAALKLAVRRLETATAEQARLAAEIRDTTRANEQRQLQRGVRDSSVFASRLTALQAQIAAEEARGGQWRNNALGLGLSVVLGFAFFVGLLARRVMDGEATSASIASADTIPDVADAELRAIRLDLQRLELLVKAGTDTKPTDHTFALAVAGELHRMQTRVKNMPNDTVGLSALQKSLERLNEALGSLGYSIPELIGKPYVQGMVLEARFVESGSLRAGESVITKVVRPQINYRGTLIQSADVEVSTG